MPHPLRPVIVAVSLALVSAVSAQQAAPPLVLSQLTWFDRAGKSLGTLGPVADHGNLEISPDGTRVAVAVMDRASRTRDIWMYPTGGGPRTRFTTDAAEENWLIFSADGTHVALTAFTPERMGVFTTPAMNATPMDSVISAPGGAWPVSWSPDGRALLYVVNSPGNGNDIWVMPMPPSGDRKPRKYQATEASENWATFSPDGRWVAFSSTASSDVPEVYVARFPNPDRLWRVSADGGTQARWRKDGKEIFYIAPDRRLMAAAVTLEAESVHVTNIEPLFQLSYPYGAYHAFDVTMDGMRFLVNTSLLSATGPRLQAGRLDSRTRGAS